MSLLKRLEHGEAGLVMPVAPASDAPRGAPATPPDAPLRHAAVNTQATEAQRSLKARVKRKLISELDPSVDALQADEVRHRLKSLFDQIVEAENLVLTRAEKER